MIYGSVVMESRQGVLMALGEKVFQLVFDCLIAVVLVRRPGAERPRVWPGCDEELP